ncbi:MAG TPA: phosphate ABC transporter substrate-binding/OmpA family protein [Pirellulaceae bacterium]|nr:phosphate ABC transporter substrate-binding/OmpA family protein [Pirellulaceae bacterium]
MAGQPKPAFYLAVFAVVAALVAFAVYRADIFAPAVNPNAKNPDVIDPTKLGGGQAEAPDTGGITTVKEFSYKPSETLPEVKGLAQYQPMQDNTVRFALNVWAGWAPIILANDGFKAGKVWKTPDGQEFKVELVLKDNPIEMITSYGAGDVHIGWGTLDMLPLFVNSLVDDSGKPRDSRAMPRVYQQVDWSNGGDGIVVRENIKTVADLRGKTIVLAENSPSHYFLLNMLVSGGVQPGEVNFKFTGDAFQAASAFNTDRDVAAAVSWAPDIYKLSEVKGNRLLVSTATANKLIADVWFARADFAKDHPGICEGLVRGIFDAMTELKKDANKQHVADLMADGYGIKPADALGMLGDAHSTNVAENYQFFMNQNNPTNFARVWNQAYYLYRSVRTIKKQPVSFDQVMDYSIIAKLMKEEKYASQKDEYTAQFVPKTTAEVRGEEEILTNTVVIHFYPNSWDLSKKITKDEDGKTIEVLYDPKVDYVVEEIGKLAGQFGNARIIIEGHTDSSMQGKVPPTMVKELSLNRANAVKEAVIKKFKLDPNKFNVEGFGWEQPSDPTDPLNHSKNRRVEVKIYTPEAAS